MQSGGHVVENLVNRQGSGKDHACLITGCTTELNQADFIWEKAV
jgi:hypothetical protein